MPAYATLDGAHTRAEPDKQRGMRTLQENNMSNTVSRMRYGVVYKGANNAMHGEGAMPEYYLQSWTEEVQEDTSEWGPEDWVRFQEDQDQELASCEAELSILYR